MYGCSSDKSTSKAVNDPNRIKKLLLNPIDNVGNFESYWVLMDTKVDSSTNPWKFQFIIPEKGKRTFVAFTNDRVYAINEFADTSSEKKNLIDAPVLGLDIYHLQPDSNIFLSSNTFPNQLKIQSINEKEIILAVSGFENPIKYQKVEKSGTRE